MPRRRVKDGWSAAEIRDALLRVRTAMRFRGELPRTRFNGAPIADLEAESGAATRALTTRTNPAIWAWLEGQGLIDGIPYRLTVSGHATLA